MGEKASASYKPDEIMIKEDIKMNLGGFQKVNERCIRILRKWLIEQACEFADAEARGDFYIESNSELNEVAHAKAYCVLKNVGTFLRHQGKFEKSIKYLKNAIMMMEDFYARDFDEKQDEKIESMEWFEQSYHKICIGLEQKFGDEKERKKQKSNFLKL